MKTSLILRRLLSYVRSSIPCLCMALLTSVIATVASLLAPIIIGRSIDLIIGPDSVDFSAVYQYLIYLGIVIVVAVGALWLQTYYTNKLTYATIANLRKEIFAKLNSVPLKYIDNTSHGNIMSLMINDIDQIANGLLQGFTQLFSGLCMIVGTLIVMMILNYLIALIVVAVTPLSLFVASFIAKRNHKMHVEQMKYRGELSGLVEEMIGNIKTIHAFSYEDEVQADFEAINEPIHKTGVASMFYSAMINPSTRFVNGIVYALVGIVGALIVINDTAGGLTVGVLSSFLTYANQYTKPFNEISGVVAELQSATAAAQRIFKCLDETSEISDENNEVLVENNGHLEINNVYFSYVEERPLIENFNLKVKKGQRIAIVGPTGCGKTTLVNLLMRFYDVNSGEIVLSNHNINDITRKSLREQYGMVLQESWLFKGTVFENIAYGKDDASLEEVITASKLSYAHNFIKRLPDGYNTMISEGGGNISQGQKQLLCIARIMLMHPSMLILDEATSSIDTRTEILLQKAFATMMENRTSFIVAHRLSTITSADVIIVMNQGHILEMGNHQQLLLQKGFYYQLYNSQFEHS